jgi:hypothetical protein
MITSLVALAMNPNLTEERFFRIAQKKVEAQKEMLDMLLETNNNIPKLVEQSFGNTLPQQELKQKAITLQLQHFQFCFQLLWMF